MIESILSIICLMIDIYLYHYGMKRKFNMAAMNILLLLVIIGFITLSLSGIRYLKI